MATRANRKPICYVIAGPNGAGKTTYALNYLPKVAKCMEFVNADLIAQGLSPLRMERALIEAGRILVVRLRELAGKRVDFAFETTLSGRSHAAFLRQLKRTGYQIKLYYLWIPSAEFSARRVAMRVKRGGHDVPLPMIRRRFGKSLRNLVTTYLPLADYISVMDNSKLNPELIAEYTGGRKIIFQPERWAEIMARRYEKDT
ncbi:MAG: zeta toxin family protein [Kiritimatiellae bacterium]|nr:zeta toxin family protein [Kiritimatiellia bacterium]